jgi:hypothetical protein
VDGRNQYVNAGVSFTRQPDLDFIHVGLAKRLADPVSVGATVKRFSTHSNSAAYKGDSVTGYDGGLSVSYALIQKSGGNAIGENGQPITQTSTPLQVGLTVDNLRHLDRDEIYLGPRQLGAGVKYNISSVMLLYGDFVENYSHNSGAWPMYFGGTELSVGSDIYLRGGLFGFRQKGWSAGLGWVGPKIGVGYGYQNQRDAAERTFQHAVTMDIYM